jgi:hypothetical protein
MPNLIHMRSVGGLRSGEQTEKLNTFSAFNRRKVPVFQGNRHRPKQQSPPPLPWAQLFAYSSYIARHCEARGIIEQREIQTE